MQALNPRSATILNNSCLIYLISILHGKGAKSISSSPIKLKAVALFPRVIGLMGIPRAAEDRRKNASAISLVDVEAGVLAPPAVLFHACGSGKEVVLAHGAAVVPNVTPLMVACATGTTVEGEDIGRGSRAHAQAEGEDGSKVHVDYSSGDRW